MDGPGMFFSGEKNPRAYILCGNPPQSKASLWEAFSGWTWRSLCFAKPKAIRFGSAELFGSILLVFSGLVSEFHTRNVSH